MLEVTYDRNARMIYCYFATIEEGEDADQRDVEGAYVLDAADQIIGLRFAVADLPPDQLSYAAQHEQVELADDILTVWFARQTPASEQAFPYAAIFDLAADERVLGVEVLAESEFDLAARLTHIQPYIVEVFEADDADDETDDDAGERAAAAPQPTAANGASDPSPTTHVPSPDIVRAGFVALLGRPNVGKSTLLNAYLGQKVSIVSPKPQTTRIPVRGILNRDDAQIIFVDTPGLHSPRSGLGEYMVQAARRAIPDSDVLCFVVDVTEAPGPQDESIAEMIKRAHKPHILVLNKVDATRKADVFLQQYRELGPWEQEVAVSAKTTDGLSTLLQEIVGRLPEGPRLFPTDQVTDLSDREQVAELVREKVLLNTSEEVPHGVAVEVDEWEQRGQRLYIRATVNVESTLR